MFVSLAMGGGRMQILCSTDRCSMSVAHMPLPSCSLRHLLLSASLPIYRLALLRAACACCLLLMLQAHAQIGGTPPSHLWRKRWLLRPRATAQSPQGGHCAAPRG